MTLLTSALVVALTLSAHAEQSIGDVDASGSVVITDVVYLINYIFGGGPEPVVAPLLVPVQFRAPGTIGQPTIADAFMLFRRNPDDSIVLVDERIVDSLLAGEYVGFTIDLPRTEVWYTYYLWYAHDELTALGDSMTIKSAEYETK